MKYNMYCDCCGWYWNAEEPEHGIACPDCGAYGTISLAADDADKLIDSSIREDARREAYEN